MPWSARTRRSGTRSTGGGGSTGSRAVSSGAWSPQLPPDIPAITDAGLVTRTIHTAAPVADLMPAYNATRRPIGPYNSASTLLPTGNEVLDEQLAGLAARGRRNQWDLLPGGRPPQQRARDWHNDTSDFTPAFSEPVGRSKEVPEGGLPLTNDDGTPTGLNIDRFGNLWTRQIGPETWSTVGNDTTNATVQDVEQLRRHVVTLISISLACIVAQANEIQIQITSGGVTIWNGSVGPRAINDGEKIMLTGINIPGTLSRAVLIGFSGALSGANTIRWTVAGHSL